MNLGLFLHFIVVFSDVVGLGPDHYKAPQCPWTLDHFPNEECAPKQRLSSNITLPELEKLLVSQSKDIFVAFSASSVGCKHSLELEPVWDQVVSLFPSTIFYKLDFQSNQWENRFNLKFSIFGFPTIAFMQQGAVKFQYQGDYTTYQLSNFVSKHTGISPVKEVQEVQTEASNMIDSNSTQHDIYLYVSIFYVLSLLFTKIRSISVPQ